MRVLLVDDHELIRHGLRRAFEQHADVEVVGEAGTVADALRLHLLDAPDVVVCDVRLPDGNGLDVTRELRKRAPQLGIVLLTMYAGDDQLFAALEAGASAFVPKSAPADEVVAAARHAFASPLSFTSGDMAAAMTRRLNPTGPQLSPRERDVLALLAEGLPVSAIARKLFISESTTKTHMSKVYEKLGAANRAQALMTALRTGLITNGDASA
ncbi:MAG: response regulator transcription factor [Mycobacteriales bacterium]